MKTAPEDVYAAGWRDGFRASEMQRIKTAHEVRYEAAWMDGYRSAMRGEPVRLDRETGEPIVRPDD